MSQITIDLREIEGLKSQIESLTMERDRLRKELKSLDTEELRNKAKKFATDLFDCWVIAVLKSIGFENNGDILGNSFVRSEVVDEHWDTRPLNGRQFDIVIGAEISNKFKHAYIQLTCDMPYRNPEKKDNFAM